MQQSILLLFQENKIKEELEKKIDKLREQADINKQEIEQGKTKIDEVMSSFTYYYYYYKNNNNNYYCQTLETLLLLDSTRQHTAISRFHVRRPTLIVHLESTGQRHGTYYQQQSAHRTLFTLQNFENQLKAHFF